MKSREGFQMTLTPRLNHLFRILLRNTEPISVSELAVQMNTSKRTVFREMENIDSLLHSYHLRITAKAGVGIWLEGNEEDRETLSRALIRLDEPEPMDKGDRRKRLIVEILKNQSVNKLYYYSNLFKVSEGTISNDMDVIADWFQKNDLSLSRRQGYGVALEGTEEAYRRALSQFIYENSNSEQLWEMFDDVDKGLKGKPDIYTLIDTNLLNRVVAAFKTIQSAKLDKMTEGSRIRLVIYLSIAVERMIKQKGIAMDSESVTRLKSDENYALADQIAGTLEQWLPFKIPDEERAYLCIHIKSAKQKYINKNQDDDFYVDHYELMRLIYRMMDYFDQDIVDELKVDELLLGGLIAHLEPTLIRLKHNMEIQNNMLEQIRNMYPDIFEQSRNAARAITEVYGFAVPEAEIGYLATHFGAAVIRLKEKKVHRKVVNIGVVCASGIGVSYLMTSRIKNMFKEDVHIESYAQGDLVEEALCDIDILVSSFPLTNIARPFILVSPLPTDEDLEKIRREINRCAYVEAMPSQKKSGDFMGQLHKTWGMAESIQSVLTQFDISYIDENVTFEELVRRAGYRFGNCEEKGKKIYGDLMAREKINTQVVDSYGFILLHAKTDGVVSPVFALILPHKAPFCNEYMKGAQMAVVMLVPKGPGGTEQGQMMGKLSSALIEDEEFLKTLKSGNRDQAYAQIQKILEEYFSHKIREFCP
jgi:mannitol operon transcriptional antiterminator